MFWSDKSAKRHRALLETVSSRLGLGINNGVTSPKKPSNSCYSVASLNVGQFYIINLVGQVANISRFSIGSQMQCDWRQMLAAGALWEIMARRVGRLSQTRQCHQVT